ncbi:MAG: ABC transporter ATP-binding protein [Ruminococcus sp.]|nr:ABC transporter ATP-binding protein [Ruminococcus sp.]
MGLTGEKLTKRFYREMRDSNQFTAVDGVDLTLEKGKLTVLTGRSGSGKTTVLNILSGLLVPTKGSVLLDGKDIYSLTDKELSKLRNRQMGIIPQGQTAIHSLNVFENIMLPYSLYGEDGSEEKASDYAEELMKRLDIAQLAGAKPSELSGGELRRMAIARALIRRPEYIFADEPTGDLDDENTAEVFEFLHSCARDGSAVLIVTHEGCASDYADEVIRMSAGKIVQK